MIKLKSILEQTQAFKPIIVFVGGIEKYESLSQQTNRIQSGLSDYEIKAFDHSNASAAAKFVKNNKTAGIILYSKGCESWKLFPSDKTYCIEPWNGKQKMKDFYSGFPSANMWVGAEDYRGNGLKTQNELVPGKGTKGHIDAPSQVAPFIAAALKNKSLGLNEDAPKLLSKNEAENEMIQGTERVLDQVLNQVSQGDVQGILNKVVDKDELKELVVNQLKPVRDHFYNRYSKCYKYDQAGDEKIITATLKNVANIFLSRINNLSFLKVSAIKTYMFVTGYDKENLAQDIENSLNSKDFKRIQLSAVITMRSIIGNMRRIPQLSVYGPICKGVDKSNTPENTYPFPNVQSITAKIINQYTSLYKDAIVKKFS